MTTGTSPPGRADALALVLAVAATSCAAPLIKFATSGALTIAFWRVALAGSAIATLSLTRRPWRISIRRWGYSWLAGLFLGAHFWIWIASLDYTQIANSVLLVTTQPVWAAIIGRWLLGERVPWIGGLGIALALGGSAVAIGYGSPVLRGDLLAIAGAVLAAAYMVVGRRERQHWNIVPYLARVYLSAAALLLVGAVWTGTPLGPARGDDWLIFAALAAIPTGIGHSLYNYALKRLPVYVVATSITGEPIGATWLALVFLGEVPATRTLVAAPLVLAGIFLVGWSQRRPGVTR